VARVDKRRGLSLPRFAKIVILNELGTFHS
jgi:hypothetical protein